MTTGYFAAAGLAEAAWAMATAEMFFAFVTVGLLALLALAIRSQRLALLAAALLALGTVFFQPWDCFWPFEEAAYSDPDVVSAASGFRTIGTVWLIVCIEVASSLLFVFIAHRRSAKL